jgi:hypothetical protein
LGAVRYGVETAAVIPVEQPGQFHIDMGMLPVGETILLNDLYAFPDGATDS